MIYSTVVFVADSFTIRFMKESRGTQQDSRELRWEKSKKAAEEKGEEVPEEPEEPTAPEPDFVCLTLLRFLLTRVAHFCTAFNF